MKTEIEVSIGQFWTEEDKALCSSVLGSDAFTYLTKCGGAISEGLVAASVLADLQNKLQNLVEADDQSIRWDYAIFWQLSRTKSGAIVLGWGDGSCHEPHDSEIGFATSMSVGDASLATRQKMQKRVLQRLHTAFAGADEEDYAPVTSYELLKVIGYLDDGPPAPRHNDGSHNKVCGGGQKPRHTRHNTTGQRAGAKDKEQKGL